MASSVFRRTRAANLTSAGRETTGSTRRGASDTAEFGVSYLGTTLEVALCESLLHDAIPVDGSFTIDIAQAESRHALYFTGEPLHLLDLTGAHLKRMGGSADLGGTTDYALTQAWAFAVFSNPARFDGFYYMSRHYNTRRAMALFDRAAPKIRLRYYFPLASAPGFARAQRRLAIRLA